ncbi:hypothetical protein [Sciscionella sediminilitoris]|uniref:hypothetical protein n=1 Tax=Sciscionella sediminilitoris TaxID=1445613 RepID=UPI0004DF51EC|nr:hypothetical protein [Sciscionella sp. SE31]
MSTFYVLDVPENTTLPQIAERDNEVTVTRVGPYFRVSSPDTIVVDRRATGCRHAVWYSAIAGLERSRITQHDKNALRVEDR